MGRGGFQSPSPQMLWSGQPVGEDGVCVCVEGSTVCVSNGLTSLQAEAFPPSRRVPLTLIFSVDQRQLASCPNVGTLRMWTFKAKPSFQVALWRFFSVGPSTPIRQRKTSQLWESADNLESFLKRFNGVNCIKGLVH